MRSSFGLFFIITSASAIATSAQTRYKDIVFPEFTMEQRLSYAPTTDVTRDGRYMLFDLYLPGHDTATRRPLMIWMHGGGFKFGSRDAAGIKLWCETFARRGYVCAAIDYRLGRKTLRFTFDELVSNCYTGVQDVRRAVAFFKANAARWGLDTNRIILAGNSAGGMLALQTVYSTNDELRHLPREDIDLVAVRQAADPGRVAAIVNFWGAIFDTAWLRQASVPIVSVHGTADGIVPYDHKGYPSYGSLPIHRMADSLHIPNALKSYTGYSHELQKHFNPLIVSRRTRQRWLEAGQFTADFLYKELFSGAGE
jgi:acetyl esterase/lipase